MADRAPNWLELEGGANARDVGGIPTANGGKIRSGALVRSANLQHLTATDIRRLVAEVGVRTIVDLRTDVEVAAEGPGPMTREPEVTIHHLSLFPDSVEVTDETSIGSEPAPGESRLLPWRDRENRPPVVTGEPVADLYLAYLERRPDSVVSALRAIAEPGATLVHCAAGKDRTGVVVAIALTLAGAERAAIVADYAATEQQIAAIMALLGRTSTYQNEVADPATVPPPTAAVMTAVLDALGDRPDGIQGWLHSHGWTATDTERLRAELVG